MGYSWTRDQNHVPRIGSRFLTTRPPGMFWTFFFFKLLIGYLPLSLSFVYQLLGILCPPDGLQASINTIPGKAARRAVICYTCSHWGLDASAGQGCWLWWFQRGPTSWVDDDFPAMSSRGGERGRSRPPDLSNLVTSQVLIP